MSDLVGFPYYLFTLLSSFFGSVSSKSKSVNSVSVISVSVLIRFDYFYGWFDSVRQNGVV